MRSEAGRGGAATNRSPVVEVTLPDCITSRLRHQDRDLDQVQTVVSVVGVPQVIAVQVVPSHFPPGVGT